MKIFKNEKFRIILFYAALTLVLTWPFAKNFFISVPSYGSDTMQVIGVAGERANILNDLGVFRGTLELAKRSEFNIVTVYAYFQLIFGRIVGYNILFLLSFIFSGFGAYLLAFYFTKNKPVSLIAGIIFAFSPFHVHNSLSTNVGTMHQEWLPFFALYLFKFFENLKLKNYALAGIFLGLIALSEHQLLAFTFIFLLFFLVYKAISCPRIFLRGRLWIYVFFSLAIFSMTFFFMFRSLFAIASSENNYLDPGFRSAVNYSNDSLSILIPPRFHSFWPKAFANIRNEFRRGPDSQFSVFAGYSVLLLSLVGVFGYRFLRKKKIPTRGIFFWLAIALGFYILSLGPYLHYRGVLDPPVRMPYILIYNYLPFYKNIRTVGRLFAWSILGFSMLAAWGTVFVISKIKNSETKIIEDNAQDNKENKSTFFKNLNTWQKIILLSIGLIIILEYLAIPFKTNSLLHSSFYEKLGQDKESYSVLEIPGNTNYQFASRDLVWKSIHRKNTINGYDFARIIKNNYTFQRGTPIIRTLLYDFPKNEQKDSDRDIMKDSYYKISNEILNYYNIRYIILDKEALLARPEEKKPNRFYGTRAYVQNVVKCRSEYEDEFLYACEVNRDAVPRSMFLAMDYSNQHWVRKDKGKTGIRRQAESGAGVKLVNMSSVSREGKFSFKLKLYRPLYVGVLFQGREVYREYVTQLNKKISVEVKLGSIQPGENDIIFEVRAADGTEVRSNKKSETVTLYDLAID